MWILIGMLYPELHFVYSHVLSSTYASTYPGHDAKENPRPKAFKIDEVYKPPVEVIDLETTTMVNIQFVFIFFSVHSLRLTLNACLLFFFSQERIQTTWCYQIATFACKKSWFKVFQRKQANGEYDDLKSQLYRLQSEANNNCIGPNARILFSTQSKIHWNHDEFGIFLSESGRKAYQLQATVRQCAFGRINRYDKCLSYRLLQSRLNNVRCKSILYC